MISGYATNGLYYKVLDLFRRMAAAGVASKEFMVSSLLATCRATDGGGCSRLRTSVHTVVVRKIVDRMSYVVNYACWMQEGFLMKHLKKTWSAGIPLLLDPVDVMHSLQLFLDMDIEPNFLTLTSITSACAGLATLGCGQQVHGSVL
ncbi:hypothetical protein PR202_ga04781 [Eleusine coracana subsp. coracana]|uniref:Pentatricopeptide repeat-containing protein n=1 Tax=Eleusine coracana subsp. coracana TaxID=191504 RepID=A0AAV5BSW3_ELECO|nr:hypothetical protein PR202_ga04781 [Eleusine coracana subsp. coracana]